MTVAPPPGFRILALDEIDSTNAEAARRAAAGEAEGLVIWARSQSAGRGRRGRIWISPAGNCYSSILLRPRCKPRAALGLGFAAALAAADAVREALGSRGGAIALKWPNDVLLDGRKISGCLMESSVGANGDVDHLVVGVGINVASHPTDTEYPATSLAAAGAQAANIEAVLTGYVEAFAAWYERWRHEGFAPIRAAWLGLATGLGQTIKVRLEDEVLDGIFSTLDGHGALVLKLADGERVIDTGEVFPVRS
ncbi:MAG: biotin--[acetyl-CoA-carboxylase] ligase [Alphaproteobacteria bacterium]